MWLRLSISLIGNDSLDVTHFAILIPLSLAIFFWLIGGRNKLHRLRQTPAHQIWIIVLVLFTMWGIASQSWAMMSSYPAGTPNFRPYIARNAALQLTVMTAFAVVMVMNPPPLRWIPLTLSVSLLVIGIVTIIQAYLQHDVGLSLLGEFEFAADQPGSSILTTGDMRWVRPYGLMPHPNHTGGYLAATWFVCGVWLLSNRKYVRWFGTFLATIGFYALLLTFSRGAWLAFAATGLVLLIPLWQQIRQQKPVRNHFLLTVVVLLVTAAIFFIQYRPLVIARAAPLRGTPTTTAAVDSGQIQSTESRSLSDRRIFTNLAWRSIRENPLLGVGLGNTPWKISLFLMQTDYDLRANYVHNTYIAGMADTGGAGFTLYLGALFTGLFAAIQQYRKSPYAERLALIAMVIALSFAGFFDYYTWALIQFQVLWWGCLAAAMSHSSNG